MRYRHDRGRVAVRWAVSAVMLVGAAGLGACGREGADEQVPGVSKDEISIGGSFPLTGPLAAAGAMSGGIETAFGAANAEGGIRGRQVRYRALDDAYDPSRTAANARRLVQRDKVFALLTGLGPGMTIRPFIEQQKTPHLNLSGLSDLSDTERFPSTRGWWPDAGAEAALVTRYALESDPEAKIGTLMLNNDLGVDMTAGIKKALGDRDDALVRETSFDATQLDVSSQINQLRSSGADVLITSATGATAIQALRYIDQIGWDAKVFLYSGSTSIKAILEKAGKSRVKGVYSALWLKDPSDPQWRDDEEVTRYREQVRRYGKGADADDLYVANGYVGGEATAAVLETMESPTQEGMFRAIDEFEPRRVPLLAPGVQLRSGENGRLIHQYQIVRFDGRSWRPVGEVVDSEREALE